MSKLTEPAPKKIILPADNGLPVCLRHASRPANATEAVPKIRNEKSNDMNVIYSYESK